MLTCVTGPWGFARGLVRLYLETPSTAPCAAILVCLKQEEFSFASAAAPAKPSGKCAQLLSAVLTVFLPVFLSQGYELRAYLQLLIVTVKKTKKLYF